MISFQINEDLKELQDAFRNIFQNVKSHVLDSLWNSFLIERNIVTLINELSKFPLLRNQQITHFLNFLAEQKDKVILSKDALERLNNLTILDSYDVKQDMNITKNPKYKRRNEAEV